MKYTHKRIFISIALAALMLVSLCAVGVSSLSVSAAKDSSSTVQAPVVGAAVGSGAPGVCSQDGKSLDLFIRSADNALWWKHSADGTTWPAATKLGGVLTSSPAATSPASGVIDVFMRGSDGRVWRAITTDAGVSWKWSSIAGQSLAGTAPSVYSWGTTNFGWFITGLDHRCYYMSQSGAKISGWQNLGGYLATAPAATALTDGTQIGLFVVGNGGSLYYKHYANGWGSWSAIGGTALAGTSPAAYNFGSSQIGWLVTGTDNNLYRNWVGSSSGYDKIKASLTSSPGAAVIGSPGNGLAVFGRISSGGTATLSQIDYNYNGNGVWGTWTAIAFP